MVSNPSSGQRRVKAAVPLAAALVLFACGAPTGPFTVSCADRGLADVTDSSRRVELRGFSVLPPAGPHWCVSIYGEPGSGIGFARNQFGGRTLQAIPSLEENAHTFAAVAAAAEVDGPRPADAAALLAFVEQWQKNGGLMQPQPSGKLRISTKPATDPEGMRFTTIQSDAVVDASLGATCVRYSSIAEERDNPRAEGGIFVIDAPESYACLHPTSPKELIVLEYSERYIKDRRPGPRFIDTLKAEIEPFLRGIRFAAAP